VTTRGLAVWSLSTLGSALITNNPVYRILVLLAAANVVVALAADRARALALGLTLAGAFAVALNVLLGHSGMHVLVVLPGWLPGIGGPLTLESLAYGLDVAGGLAAAILAVAPLSLAADPTELVDALPRVFERAGTSLAAALGFVPAIAQSFTAVSDAQRMRGWRPRGPRSWGEVLVPVMVTAIENSIQLAESMESRGFGAGPRTRYPRPRSSAWNLTVPLLAVIAFAGLAAGRVSGAIPDWYPLPALQPPDVKAFGVICCLLLGGPALLWRSQPSIG